MADIPQAPRVAQGGGGEALFKPPVGLNPAILPAVNEMTPNITSTPDPTMEMTPNITEDPTLLPPEAEMTPNFSMNQEGADENIKQNMTAALAELMLGLGE